MHGGEVHRERGSGSLSNPSPTKTTNKHVMAADGSTIGGGGFPGLIFSGENLRTGWSTGESHKSTPASRYLFQCLLLSCLAGY